MTLMPRPADGTDHGAATDASLLRAAVQGSALVVFDERGVEVLTGVRATGVLYGPETPSPARRAKDSKLLLATARDSAEQGCGLKHLAHHGGRSHIIQVRAHEVTSEGRKFLVAALTNMDFHIAELQRDPLYDIWNRYAFEDKVEQLQRDARDPSDLIGWLFFLDCNHFKRINTKYGSQAGDAVIGEMVRRIKATARSTDNVYCARRGGDEFLLLCATSDMNETGAEVFANRLKGQLSKPFQFEDHDFDFLSAAVGFAPVHARSGYGDVEDLAEQMMKCDKDKAN